MMPHNNMDEIPFISQIVVLFLGIAGAIINYSRRRSRGGTMTKKIGMFIVDTATSGALSVIGFYGALGYGLNELMSIAIAGVLAHQGTRAMYIVELVVTEKIGAIKTHEEIKKGKNEI